MATGVTKQKAEVWRKRGNNWRKEGRALPTGTRVIGEKSGIYFYMEGERRTKAAWIKFEDLPPVVIPPDEPGELRSWYFVKHQWMRRDAAEYHSRIGQPHIFRAGEKDNPKNGHYTPLNKAWQFFCFDLCCLVYYGKTHEQLTKAEYIYLAKKLASVWDSKTVITNGHGSDICRNYVLDENDGAEDIAVYTLFFAGASVNGIEEDKMLAASYFDGTQMPPDVRTIDPFTDPRVMFATTGKDYAVRPFAQFDGKDVPVPIIASKPIYFPLEDLELYTATKKRSPYYP